MNKAVLTSFLLVAMSDLGWAESALDALERYGAAVEELASVNMTGTVNRYNRGGMFDERTWVSVEKVQIVLSGSQWRYRLNQRGNNYKRTKTRPFANAIELYRDKFGNRYECVTSIPLENESLFSEDDTIDWSEINADRVTVVLDDNPQGLSGELRRQEAVRILFGCFVGDDHTPAYKVMRESGPQFEGTEEIAGVETAIVAAQSDRGSYRLWLAPSLGYLPLRMQCEKSGSDLFLGKPVHRRDAKPSPSDRRPQAPRIASKQLVDEITIKRVNGRQYVTGYKSSLITDYGAEGKFEQEDIAVFEWAPASPELAVAERSLPIPNGTNVRIRNAPIDCEYQDGQLVALYSGDVVTSLDDVRMESGRSYSMVVRAFIIGSIVVIIAVALILRNRQAEQA